MRRHPPAPGALALHHGALHSPGHDRILGTLTDGHVIADCVQFADAVQLLAPTRAWPRSKLLRPVRSVPRTSMSARVSCPYPGSLLTTALSCSRGGRGYASLCSEISDSLSWRRFYRIGPEQSVPDESTIRKITSRCGPQLIEDLNEQLPGKPIPLVW